MVLFRTNKSDKVNDQRWLSLVYSFTGIYLHTYFSFFREIWKSCILLREILGYKTLPSFEQILIKQAYFLVKNGAPYWWINTV